MRRNGRTPAEIFYPLSWSQHEALGELLGRGRRQRFAAGSILFRQGSASSSVIFLQRGTVKVTSSMADGSEPVLAVRGPGDVIGELGALDGRHRSATVTALDQVLAVVIPASAFREVLEHDGRLAVEVLTGVIGRLRDADRERAEFGSIDAARRLALRLLELSARYGETAEDARCIAVALSQEELAGRVGASREAVAKALRRFRDAGWVETGRRQVTILDEAALRAYGTGGSEPGTGAG